MRKHAAFFDVDETLINIKSMFDFYDFWCRENNQNDRLQRYMSRFRADVKNGVLRETLNREYYRQFKGVSCRYLEEMGEKWFRRKLESEFFIESAVSALKKTSESEHVYRIYIGLYASDSFTYCKISWGNGSTLCAGDNK